MGVVHFVGAGPGDPGLLTVRGAELLRRASLVLYGPGLDARVLTGAAPEAEVREVTDADGVERRVELLAAAVPRGEVIVRLCAGDPLAAPGTVRELLLLRERGVPVEVTPGLFPAAAVPAFAGVPLTGPDGDDAPPPGLAVLPSPAGSAGPAGTDGPSLRILTVEPERLGAAVDALSAAGWPAETPAAVVSQGAGPRQRTVAAALSVLPERAASAGLSGPLLLLAGATVALRPRLEWFEGRPLFGRRIVVTRARAQAAEFVATLEALGAEVITFPVIRVVSPPDARPLERAAATVREYDWVVFTSVNGVDRFRTAVEQAGHDARALAGTRIAAIGPATAAALETWGLRADLVPDTYVAEAVLDAMASRGPLTGARVLLPRAFGAREILPEGLEALGAVVDEVEAYRSEADAEGAAALQRRLEAGGVDVVTFTSSSTVTRFVEAVGGNLHGAAAACIGPITAATAREAGLPVEVVAESHTIPGLTAALLRYYQNQERGIKP